MFLMRKKILVKVYYNFLVSKIENRFDSLIEGLW